MRRVLLTLATAGLLVTTPAWADDTRQPRLEIGANLSALAPLAFEDSVGLLIGGGPHLTVNLSRRIALELRAESFGQVEESGILGVYITQIKIPVKRSASGMQTVSVTAGAAGGASYRHFEETRRTRPDGSTVVHPEFRELRMAPPNTLAAGVSGAHVINRHLSGTWGAQFLIGGFGGAMVASAGISFGLGGYR
jgi:hypothetical protein